MDTDCCTGIGTIGIEERRARKNEALSSATWGAGVLWGGLVLLAHETGILAAARVPMSPAALFFVGFGLIFAVAIAITLLVPGYRHADFAAYVLCAGALGLGLSSWAPAWPAVVIALGVVMVARSASRLRGSAD